MLKSVSLDRSRQNIWPVHYLNEEKPQPSRSSSPLELDLQVGLPAFRISAPIHVPHSQQSDFLNSRYDSFILLLKNFRWFPSPLICKLISFTNSALHSFASSCLPMLSSLFLCTPASLRHQRQSNDSMPCAMAFHLSGASSSFRLPRYTRFILRKKEVENGREREREQSKGWRRREGRKR